MKHNEEIRIILDFKLLYNIQDLLAILLYTNYEEK